MLVDLIRFDRITGFDRGEGISPSRLGRDPVSRTQDLIVVPPDLGLDNEVPTKTSDKPSAILFLLYFTTTETESRCRPSFSRSSARLTGKGFFKKHHGPSSNANLDFNVTRVGKLKAV